MADFFGHESGIEAMHPFGQQNLIVEIYPITGGDLGNNTPPENAEMEKPTVLTLKSRSDRR
ncbi:MAG TPA: hypothetical protein VLH15_07500 [Dehalococcoidales bacterium]|nr:hypothetical protein [Dehalococcoidales bacterium]